MLLLDAEHSLLMLSGEYSNLTKMLGGKVIKIEQGKPAGINPFELEADYKGKEKFLNILDKVAEIRALIAEIMVEHLQEQKILKLK